MSSSVRMVVFDLGGVLIRICRSWEEACGRAGVEVREGWAEPSRRAQRERLSAAYQLGRMGCEEYFAEVAATVPGLYSAAEVRRVHDAWLVDEYEGVHELIGDLHRSGVPTGVLSNTNASHWERLAGGSGGHAEFRAPGLVHHLHASHLMGAAKPDVSAFRAFEARAGIGAGGVSGVGVGVGGGGGGGGGVIFFDDLAENVAGACRAGWSGVLVDHAGDTASQMRHALVGRGVAL